MAEYIEREAAKKEFNLHFGGVSHAVIASKLLDSIPAADVVPVVRCKECTHRHDSEFCECRPEDFFCADGERRTTMKCETCLNKRPVVSENGIHYVCCLSSRKAIACMTGRDDKYIENPMQKEGR